MNPSARSLVNLDQVDGEVAGDIDGRCLSRTNVDRRLGVLDHSGAANSMTDGQIEPSPYGGWRPFAQDRIVYLAQGDHGPDVTADPARRRFSSPSDRLDTECRKFHSRLPESGSVAVKGLVNFLETVHRLPDAFYRNGTAGETDDQIVGLPSVAHIDGAREVSRARLHA